jgi:hypothetical protein
MPDVPDPSAVKATENKSVWEKTIVATPVILTVVATILVGLSTSELNLAQYYRGLAAQMQSKISDQWAYFQAKRIRADQNENSAALLQSISQPMPFDPANLSTQLDHLMQQMNAAEFSGASPQSDQHFKRAKSLVDRIRQSTTQPDNAAALARFAQAKIQQVPEQPIEDAQINEVIAGLDTHVSDTDLQEVAGKVTQPNLNKAIETANANTAAHDAATAADERALSEIQKLFSELSTQILAFEASASPGASPTAVRDAANELNAGFTVASMRYNAARLNVDAHYNQSLAQVYEVQVRKHSFDSDRHRQRSKEFFFGMLAAQAGVTIATFALAVHRKSVLWGLAAAAGLAAIAFAAYVYVSV